MDSRLKLAGMTEGVFRESRELVHERGAEVRPPHPCPLPQGEREKENRPPLSFPPPPPVLPAAPLSFPPPSPVLPTPRLSFPPRPCHSRKGRRSWET